MYKKVKIVTEGMENTERNILEAALLTGFPIGDVVQRESGPQEYTYVFLVNRIDLPDLRHVIELLNRCGIRVKEERAD